MGVRQAVILVHGFNVRDKGKRSVGKLESPLKEELPGVEIIRFGYKYTFVFRLPYRNKVASDKLADLLLQLFRFEGMELITIVAHSNGAFVADLAVRKSAVPAQLVAVNPALRKRYQFAPEWDNIAVCFSPCDCTVVAGRWWGAATRALPWRWFRPHPWGIMGRVGYKGNDGRVVLVRMDCDAGHSKSLDKMWLPQQVIAPLVERYALEFDHMGPLA